MVGDAPPIRVHAGFLSSYLAVRDDIFASLKALAAAHRAEYYRSVHVLEEEDKVDGTRGGGNMGSNKRKRGGAGDSGTVVEKFRRFVGRTLGVSAGTTTHGVIGGGIAEVEGVVDEGGPPPMPIAITGHSLGGALATLAAYEINTVGVQADPAADADADDGARDYRERSTVVGGDGGGGNDGGGGGGGGRWGGQVERRLRRILLGAGRGKHHHGRGGGGGDDYGLAAQVIGVWTFGSPRVGDVGFAEAYAKSLGASTWRVTHAHDIVPSVPIQLMGFHHVPTEVFYAPHLSSGPPAVCDGSGEDVKCSDGEWTHTSIVDHLYYLGTYICGCNI